LEARSIHEANSKTDILYKFGFKQFELSTVELYEQYLSKMNGPTGSYMRVANILCWGFYSVPYYKLVNDFFIIINDDGYYDCFSVYAPIGDYSDIDSLEEALLYIKHIFDLLEEQVKLLQVKEWMMPYFDRITSLSLEYAYDEGESDYLYNLSDLKESIKRRKIHYDKKTDAFIKNFNPIVKKYEPEYYDRCMEIVTKMYCEDSGCETCVFGCMKTFYDRVFDIIEKINGQIILFVSEERLLAFVVFVDDEDLLYFDRKATHDLTGFSEYLNEYICREFSDSYEVMNFEEDMGSPGLRRHKRALGPYTLSHNYYATVKGK